MTGELKESINVFLGILENTHDVKEAQAQYTDWLNENIIDHPVGHRIFIFEQTMKTLKTLLLDIELSA